MYIIAVTGGRDYTDRDTLYAALGGLRGKPDMLLQGGASGADKLAHQWATATGVLSVTYHAAWERHGRAAGPLRNSMMLKHGTPELLVAFPGGPGTAHCVAEARRLGIPVLLVGGKT